jgi:hypothetical protein
MPRYLFIVAKEHPELGAHLEREFAGEDGVVVVLDRRRGDRRRSQAVAPSGERRRTARRSQPSIQQELAALNFALVRAD